MTAKTRRPRRVPDHFVDVNKTIQMPKTACEVSGHPVADHFVDVNKMVDLGSGSQREIEDIMLTRYACYLIAQNGDPVLHAKGKKRDGMFKCED